MHIIDKKDKTKMVRLLFLLPIIPAIIIYKHFTIEYSVITVAAFWVVALVCILSNAFSTILYNSGKKTFHILGQIVSVCALIIIYICTVFPTGMLMKIVKRDRLRVKDKKVTSYWKNIEHEITNYEFQF